VLVNLGGASFGTPAYLWLLAAPAALLALWAWRTGRRIVDLQRLRQARFSPVRERWSLLGDLPLWLCVILACAGVVVALARPQAAAPGLARAGLDIIVLLDGSASMHVDDVPGGSRWQRSVQFLRQLGDALRWDDDRLALTVFARVATPQVRLTRDPNTVFFFLDHLGRRSPFPLEDDATWDTNLEQAIGWGLRVLHKDRELHGRSRNAPAFLLLSDGETWSGEVARGIDRIRTQNIPLFVAGVGTVSGGRMPELPIPDEDDPPPTMSYLDRRGLQRLATEGRGLYFELERARDRDVANAVIDAGRQAVPPVRGEVALTAVYWPALALACGLAAAGTVFTRRRAPMWLQAAGALVALAMVLRTLG
jgi:von Willebrand factor type A domain